MRKTMNLRRGMKKRPDKRRIMRYFCAFTALAVVICISLTILQCVYTDYLIKREVNVNSRNAFVLLKHSYDTLFRQIERVISPLFDNQQYLNIMTYYEQNNYIQLIAIRDQMDSLLRSMSEITNLCIYFPAENYTFSTNQTIAEINTYHDKPFLTRLVADNVVSPRTYVRDVHYANESQSVKVVTLARTLPLVSKNRSVAAYVLIDLDFNMISSNFENLAIGNDSSMMIFDETGTLISAVGTPYTLDELAPPQAPRSGEIDFYEKWLDNDEIYVYVTAMQEPAWTYVYAQNISSVNRQMLETRNTILVICFGVLLASTLYAWYASKRLYRPIGMISAQLGDESVDVFSRIDKMIAENEQMSNTLQENAVTGRNRQLLHRLLLGTAEPALGGELTGLLPACQEYVVCLVRVPDDGDALSQGRIGAMAAQADMRLQVRLFVVSHEIALILSASSFSVQNLRRFAQALLTEADEGASVGVSRPFGDPSGLSDAYQQAKEALGMYLVRGAGSVCCFVDIRNIAAPEYPYKLENALLCAFRNRDMDDINRKMEKFEGYLVAKDTPPQYVRDFYMQLFCSCQRLTLDRPGAGTATLNYSHHDLLAMDSIGGMSEYIISMLSDLLSAAAQSKTDTRSALVEEVCAYIAAHLSELPTVDQLASMYYMSASSLRAEFTRVTGMSIKAYTDQKRVETAKELLTKRSLRVQDIAGKLGFQYAQSFISFFKGLTGMTPGEYRQQYGRMSAEDADTDDRGDAS